MSEKKWLTSEKHWLENKAYIIYFWEIVSKKTYGNFPKLPINYIWRKITIIAAMQQTPDK